MPLVGVSQDLFSVKSRRGRITRVVREHYLRDDIPTGYFDRKSSSEARKKPSSTSTPGLHDEASHFVIPDVNTLLRFLQVFETAREWKDIIILQTVLERFQRLATSRACARLQAIIDDPARRFVLFDNEHHHRTFQPRGGFASSGERDLCAVSRAAEFIASEAKEEAGNEGERSRGDVFGSRRRKLRAVVVIWDPVAEAPLTQTESIRGVTYESMGRYMSRRWRQHQRQCQESPDTEDDSGTGAATSTSGDGKNIVWRVYQDVLQAEQEQQRRLETARGYLSNKHSDEGCLSNNQTDTLRVTLLQQQQQAAEKAEVLSSSNVSTNSATPGNAGTITLRTTSGKEAKQRMATKDAYAGHLELQSLEALRREGKVFIGKLCVSGVDWRNSASVTVSGADQPRLQQILRNQQQARLQQPKHRQDFEDVSSIWITGFENRNRAIDGDLVYVKLLPRRDWTQPAPKLVVIKDDDRHQGGLGASDEKKEGAPPAGVVVGIKKRNWREFVCTIQRDENAQRYSSTRRKVLAVPLDRKLPRVWLQTTQVSSLSHQRLVCRLSSWPKTSNLPFACYVRSLGPVGSIETETQAICIERGVYHPPFSPFLLKGLPVRAEEEGKEGDEKAPSRIRYKWDVPESELSLRRDLRHALKGCVFSIDPPGCEDVDDALSIRVLSANVWEIGVHIADVTHFLREESALDAEARARATSVYLVDRRLDMLPKVLSADLCSLRGGTDRLAVSVVWQIKAIDSKEAVPSSRTPLLEVKNVWFGRTIIHNTAAISYQEAQQLVDLKDTDLVHDSKVARDIETNIDGDATLDLVSIRHSLVMLQRVARVLRNNRKDAGALELQSFAPEFQKLPQNDGKFRQMKAEERDIEMHHTVEEMMIFANCTVAEKIFHTPPLSATALLRRHPLPSRVRFSELEHLASSQGLSISTQTNKTLQLSLDKATDILHAKHSNKRKGKGGGGEWWCAHWSSKLLKSLATKAMAEAQYVAAGDFLPNLTTKASSSSSSPSLLYPKQEGQGGKKFNDAKGCLYHYGLAAELYTHFTSPIRRYADIIVHRQLMQAVGLSRRKTVAAAPSSSLSSPSSPPRLPFASKEEQHGEDSGRKKSGMVVVPQLRVSVVRKMATRCNERNRAAKLAAKDSQKLFLHSYLLAHGPLRAQAIVHSIKQNGFLAFVPDLQTKVRCRLIDSQGVSTGVLVSGRNGEGEKEDVGSRTDSKLSSRDEVREKEEEKKKKSSSFEQRRMDQLTADYLMPKERCTLSTRSCMTGTSQDTLCLTFQGKSKKMEIRLLQRVNLMITAPSVFYRVPDPEVFLIFDENKLSSRRKVILEENAIVAFGAFKEHKRATKEEKAVVNSQLDTNSKSTPSVPPVSDMYDLFTTPQGLSRCHHRPVSRSNEHDKKEKIKPCTEGPGSGRCSHVRNQVASRILWGPPRILEYEELVRASGADFS